MLAALTALQQADTAFPSGSFAFSNGLEGLITGDPAFDEAALARTVAAALRFRWAGTDRVALILAHRAGPAIEQLAVIDAAVEAASLAEPMRVGSRRNGASLLASHARLGTPGAADLRAAVRAGRLIGHLPTIQGALWPGLGLDERTAASVSGYLFASGLTSAAVRLGAIGAIEAQRSLGAALPIIAELLEEPVPDSTGEIELTGFTPLIEIAAMRQAQAELRLFAN
ncbi:Urease accessory protein UreF [Methylorubrum aminovorans]|uniref:Urease accessory protein UreF n=1 Tax=Methylorubrum aminovorans TaxID=269069 RepID=A0ABQ4UHX4_9HYPH|nr:urease accessory UreF family protein [Methylorubrum aminovorans]GJE66402.1 Urease accessory protein UreF [Methylorubrum aminovorans]GMA77548.1 urease accessory protein UreF 1 [Methylorubrum aminovorans]